MQGYGENKRIIVAGIFLKTQANRNINFFLVNPTEKRLRIDIGAGQNADDVALLAVADRWGEKSCKRCSARRFDDESHLLIEKAHRGDNLFVRDGGAFVDVSLQQRPGNSSRLREP